MLMSQGFDPAAQYKVSTWRGIEHGIRQYRDGEVITVADVPATTLFTFYRFHQVVKVPPATISQSASGPQAVPAATRATLPAQVSSVQPQQRSEGGDATPPTPPLLDRQRLASASMTELKRECEVRGLDSSGDRNQLRARLFALVG